MDTDAVKRIVSLEQRLARLETLEQPGKAYGAWGYRPANPFVGQRYFDTGRNLDYVWDGTRWLTVQLFTGTLTGVLPPVTASLYDKSSVTISAIASNAGSYIVPRSFGMGFYINGGTFDASNYWQVRLFLGFASNVGTLLTLSTLFQTGYTTGMIYSFATNFAPATYTNAYTVFRLSFIAVGSPGPLEFNGPTITYQAAA